MWLYPEHIRSLCDSLALYRKGALDIEALQAILSNTADVILAHEEAWLRRCLLDAENRLELLRFTCDSTKLFAASLDVVEQIERRLREPDDGQRGT